MKMDVSLLFKACVKTTSLYNKQTPTCVDRNFNDLSSRRKPNSFITKTQVTINQIANLYEYLLENRRAYINLLNNLPSRIYLSDNERDKIDTIAHNKIASCSQLIKELKRDLASSNTTSQNQEHCEIIILIIQQYLKNVCKIYSENKAVRVKKTIELRKISKLESIEKRYTHNANMHININNHSLKVQELNGDINNTVYAEDEQPSSEDFQLFQTENEQLYNNLNTLTEDIRQIESKVVHVGELQEIFTEKILYQDKNIERVLTTVIGSTENVKEANEQIRQAIQRNAGLRVWILFFLLVLSFTLLFADWYNP